MRFMRGILAVPTQTSTNSAPVPVKVARQPLPEPETALSGRAVAPCGRNLGHPQSEAVGLDRELNPQLEAADRLDGDLVQQSLGIEAEIAGRVMYRQSAEPVERKARRALHGALQEGTA